MHGNYHIKVMRGDLLLYEYSAPTHPTEGQRVEYADESLLVNGVHHVLKCGRNGFDTYYSLDYVELRVY